MHDEPIRIIREDVLSDDYFTLKKLSYEQRRADGSWQRQTREVYDNASGAAVLLYDPERRTVLLTRQFRAGARLAGEPGFLIEVPAGMLDDTKPEQRVRVELMEETGVEARKLRKLFTLYASPASLTERVHYFLGEYSRADRKEEGGGEKEEGEDIEVLEMDVQEALRQVDAGGIRDAKTVILLQALRDELRG
ncbi:GDP-mannose pyrophosphatase [Massilia sp. KIM]|uniref:NUDIX domain-containing protein n=1 Tax=Massilia sp. KIM TaxID=1955422 RepID=UPI00098FB27D|nr:NUDIX domain-containing protein [Massilia sp. KIM]OON63632.1 GDP-mannose pyrophosphatase [Massilia sp. KIM]